MIILAFSSISHFALSLTVVDFCFQVEIVMALEEEFKISVEEENAGSITTVQEAADLIEKLVEADSVVKS